MKNINILIGVVIGVIILMLFIAVFFAGVFVGKRQNRSFTRSGRGNFSMQDMRRHGVIGVVASIGNNKIMVKERTGEVKVIVLDTKTKLTQDRSTISFSKIKVGDTIIVLGESVQSDGTLKAKIIRVVDWHGKKATSSGAIIWKQ